MVCDHLTLEDLPNKNRKEKMLHDSKIMVKYFMSRTGQ